jgi:SWI/SNF-related matrix-associated actin-dependent regulator 1 of chromatin subfamily A
MPSGLSIVILPILDANKGKIMEGFFGQEHFMIVNYDLLNKFSKRIENFMPGHVIIDESHRWKGYGATKRFANIKKLVTGFPDAKFTFLSGTPVPNRINDIFGCLNVSDHAEGRVYKEFEERHLIKQDAKIVGAKDLDILYAKLGNFMIRKTKENCGFKFPPQLVEKIFYSPEDYRPEYDRIIQEMIDQGKDISNIQSYLTSLNRLVSISKTKNVIELIEDMVEEGRKPLIFSNFIEPLNILSRHFKSFVRIDGSTKAWERDVVNKRFQNDPKVEGFLGQIEAASEAIDLSASSDVILLDIPFTPRPIEQAKERASKEGKEETINIYFIMAQDSIDEYLFDMVASKAVDINTLIDRGPQATVDYENIPMKLYKKLTEKSNETKAKEEIVS